MRDAINNNPIVRLAVIGVMALAVAFLLFTRVLKSEPAEEPVPPATAPPAATVPGTAATPPTAAPATTPSPDPAAAPASPTGAEVAPAPAPAGEPSPDAFVAGPGLPKKVVGAYERDKAVVLLITRSGGIDDRAIRAGAARLRARGDVALFHVPATKLSDYARISEGVGLSRVPALIVIRPRELSGGVPEASVSYGFRSPASIEQAVEDAAFDGKSASYDP